MTTAAPIKLGFDRILVPVDFTDISKRAIDYARAIARRHESSIVVAHVAEELSLHTQPEVVWFEQLSVRKPAEENLQEWGRELESGGLKARTEFLTGAIQEEVLNVAERDASDLIVLGTHGREGIQRLFFGSDAEGLYRHAKCPIFVVGPSAPTVEDAPWQPRTMIFSCNLDPASAPLAARAFQFAQDHESTLTIFHVDDSQGRIDKRTLMQAFEEALQPLLPKNQKPVYIWRTLMLGFGIGATIANLARERHADLIIMGARISSLAKTHLPNGIAPQVMSKAPCPVMVLHNA
jgi:nucleotide-binding universal stress UspA family protein